MKRPPRPAPAEGTPELIARLEPERQRHDLPALAAALVTSRGLESLAVTGWRHRDREVPATTNDLWHLGSNTKAFTAVLAGRLVERGLLRWDTRVAEVFPDLAGEFHPDIRPVTLRDLLAHRAGVAANLDWGRLARQGTVRAQRLAAVKQGLAERPEHPPGRRFSYSNLGYVVAGAVLERVTDRAWEDLMRSEIFEPLGMTQAGFGGVGTPGALDQPWGHLQGGRPAATNGPEADNPPVLGPAGTLHCSLADWGRFVADHLRGLRGHPGLLQPATYRELTTAVGDGGYGLGWVVTRRDWAGGPALNHCGCNTLFFANVWLAPESDFAVLVVANQGLDAFAATDAAAAAVVRDRAHLIPAGPKSPRRRPSFRTHPGLRLNPAARRRTDGPPTPARRGRRP